jgi:hypothetical protein
MGVSHDNAVATPPGKFSISRAILIGKIWVGLPFYIFGYGGLFALLILLTQYCNAECFKQPKWFIGGFVFLFLLQIPAYTWRAYSAQKWLAWAMHRADDPPSLLAAANTAGLVISSSTLTGRILSHRIFWSRQDRERYQELLRERTPVKKPEAS